MARIRRYSRYSPRREKKLQHREWYPQIGGGQETIPNDTTTHLQKVFFDNLKADDCTILRTRGIINVELSVTGTLPVGVFGALVLPSRYQNEASNLPDPTDKSDTDNWFVWSPLVFIEVADESSNASERSTRCILPVDSKAMRKMSADEGILGIIAWKYLGAPGAGASADISYSIRTLVGY